MKAQWIGVIEIFQRYWRYYGGWKSAFSSPYTAIALIISLIGIPHSQASTTWIDNAISVSSSLLGFSFAAYAILLAFGNEGFLQLMSKKKEENGTSVYMRVNASFVHFIVAQFISLLLCNVCLSLLSMEWDEKLAESLLQTFYPDTNIRITSILTTIGLWFVYFIYIYSIAMALASTMAVFRLSDIYGKYLQTEKQNSSTK